ncbi:MAG: glutaminyl-peptide cyclotransferase [Flavobacteriales bacterium]
MKKIIIWLLVIGLLVGFLAPLFTKDELTDAVAPSTFGFKENLATSYGQTIPMPISSSDQTAQITLSINDSVVLDIKQPKSKELYFLNTKQWKPGAYVLDLQSKDKDGQTYSEQRNLRILSDLKPERWTVSSVKRYPHNTKYYTQGLTFLNGQLYESTGDPNQDGSSLVAQMNLATGEPLPNGAKVGLDASKFGEGITILNGELFQLTWKNQQCFVYDAKTLTLKKEFSYVGEGWGLCTDGKSLIMSDGTERITFRDPKTFEIIRTIEVYTNEGPVPQLNELEFIDGYVYANIYSTNYIVVFEPTYGRVIALVDATKIVNEGRGNGEVLNGIAWEEKSKKLYLTGKYWPTLFEVNIQK